MADDEQFIRIRTTGLANPRPGNLHPLSSRAVTVRGSHWWQAGDRGSGNSSIDDSSSQHHHGEGGSKMSFRKRLMREFYKVYEELVSAAVFVLPALFCLALVLFVALLAGVMK